MSVTKLDTLERMYVYRLKGERHIIVSTTKKNSPKYIAVVEDVSDVVISNLKVTDEVSNNNILILGNLIEGNNIHQISFYISLENLLEVLNHSGCSIGMKIPNNYCFALSYNRLTLIVKDEKNKNYKLYLAERNNTIIKNNKLKHSKITKANLQVGHAYKDVNNRVYLVYGLYYKNVGNGDNCKAKRMIVYREFKDIIEFRKFNKEDIYSTKVKYSHEKSIHFLETIKFTEDLGKYVDLERKEVLNNINYMYSIENNPINDFFRIGGLYNLPLALIEYEESIDYILRNRTLDILELYNFVMDSNNSRIKSSVEYFVECLWKDYYKYKFYDTKLDCEKDLNVELSNLLNEINVNILKNKDNLYIGYFELERKDYCEKFKRVEIDLWVSSDKEELENKIDKNIYNDDKLYKNIIKLKDFLV